TVFSQQKPPPASQPVSLQRNVQPIFTQSCALAGCHDATHQENLDLRPGSTFNPTFGIVGVPSVEAAGVMRVNAGASGSSYLVNKIEGTQATVHGSGVRMPPTGPLADSDIETIRRWIDEGARNN